MKKAVCTSCGYHLDVDTEKSVGTCEACGSTFVIENAVRLSQVEVDRTKDLANLRKLLASSVDTFDYEGMQQLATQILTIIPNDFPALYFQAFAAQQLHKPKYMVSFFKNTSVKFTSDDMDTVLTHMMQHCDLRDRSYVENYIKRMDATRMNEFSRLIKGRIQQEEHYAAIPRDVFVCHRSTDAEAANAVMQVLENDGLRCWISSRNLRPNDSENYWSNIEDGIRSCQLFLVITSQDAMLSKDVQTEMEMALKYGKQRVELKIDAAEHTSYFKHYFDGIKWIDASTDFSKALQHLKERLHDLLKRTKKQQIDPTTRIGTTLKDSDESRYIIRYWMFEIFLLISCYATLLATWIGYEMWVYATASSIGLAIFLLFELDTDRKFFARFGYKRKKNLVLFHPVIVLVVHTAFVLGFLVRFEDYFGLSNALLQVLFIILTMYIAYRMKHSEQYTSRRQAQNYILMVFPAVINLVLGILYMVVTSGFGAF